MPYSDDKKRLVQMLPYLNSMAEGKDVEFKITRGNANTVGFRLREALRLARIYAHEYPALAKYAGDYSIRVENNTLVKAVRRTPMVSAVEMPKALPFEPPPPPRPAASESIDVVEAELIRTIGHSTSALEQLRAETHRDLMGTQTAITVVDAYMRFGAVRPTLNFPEAGLSEVELFELFKWADQHTPRLMLMVAEPSLTVALWDPMVAEYSWRPQDIEVGDESPRSL